jgi:hypothetical protein
MLIYVKIILKKIMKNVYYQNKKCLLSDRQTTRSTQNYSSEPHKRSEMNKI